MRTDVVIRNKPHPVFCRQELNGPCRGYSHLSIRQGRVAGPRRCQKSAGKPLKKASIWLFIWIVSCDWEAFVVWCI